MLLKKSPLTGGAQQRAEFLTADCGQPLPFEDNSFDIVVCVDAVSHFADRQAAFEDWFRHLVSGLHILFLTDAVVLTGALYGQQFDIRASQGNLVLVPAGFNETALSQAGFRLKNQEDTTTLAARKQREQSLQQIEGAEWFEMRQAFLAITADLAAVGKLSRFRWMSRKNQLNRHPPDERQVIAVFRGRSHFPPSPLPALPNFANVAREHPVALTIALRTFPRTWADARQMLADVSAGWRFLARL